MILFYANYYYYNFRAVSRKGEILWRFWRNSMRTRRTGNSQDNPRVSLFPRLPAIPVPTITHIGTG